MTAATNLFSPLQMALPTLRRAPKVAPFVAHPRPDALALCLELWKAWMGSDSDKDLGAKTMRGLVGDGGPYAPSMHEAQQASDIKIAEATDAMIDSMKRIHVWAIYKSCSIATPWRFPNAAFEQVAEDARADLALKLRKNICTAVLF